MAELTDDALRAKQEGWRKKYTTAQNNARKSNLDTAAVKKDAMSRLFKEVERAGIPVDAFKDEMKMLDHADKARGVRADVIAEDDHLKLEAFDRLTMLAGENAMPLFDSATKSEIKKNAAKRPPADDEESEEGDEKGKGKGGGKDGGDGKVVAIGGTAIQ